MSLKTLTSHILDNYGNDLAKYFEVVHNLKGCKKTGPVNLYQIQY